jgi:predicted TIM-barrel fold metal-dependent hydrolase
MATVESKYPFALDLGLASTRSAQPRNGVALPHGLKVISADNHCEITEDIFYDEFPGSMKARAPRVWFDRYWHMGFRDGQEAWAQSGAVDDFAVSINVLNGFDSSVRRGDLEAEGIQAEVAFPQSLFGFLRHKDLEVRELMYRTYNRYVAKLGAQSPGRFHGVGVFANWWDPSKADDCMQQIVDLGLKTFMTPTLLKDVAGKEMSFAAEQMERFWSVAEAAGLPVNFHIGEDPAFGERGAHATYFMSTTSPFRKLLAQLVFGGVFDRHPKLRIVFTEAGINWVAGFLQDAELYYGTYCHIPGNKPKHPPSYYWHEHCYATFQMDKLGLELLDYIGANRVMWGADYPHSEGSFGYTWTAMQQVMARVTEAQTRDILGDTARRVYGL